MRFSQFFLRRLREQASLPAEVRDWLRELTGAMGSPVVRATAWPEEDFLGELAAAERVVYCELRHPQRRREWLLGRLCAKRALLAFLARSGVRVGPSEVIVLSGDGPPCVTWSAALAARLPAGFPRPGISISHSGGAAVAVAFPGSRRVGIDLQAVIPLSERLQRRVFTPAERSGVGAGTWFPPKAPFVALWAAKEAAIKAVQEGWTAVLSGVTIREVDGPVFRGRYRKGPGRVGTFRSGSGFDGVIVPVLRGRYWLGLARVIRPSVERQEIPFRPKAPILSRT